MFWACMMVAGPCAAQTVDPSLGGPGEPAHGEALFKQRCATCHQAEKDGKNGLGPALYGAYGRPAGQVAGFDYSAGLKTSGIVWTPENLNRWIQKPSSLANGVKMMLPPVTAPQDRADIIAFLRTKSQAPAEPDKRHKAKHASRHKS